MNGALRLRARGVWLVTSLELRQRIRSARWYVAMGIWVVVLVGLAVLVMGSTFITVRDFDVVQGAAAVLFSLIAMLVLMALLMVLPAMSAGSINGDRSAGTLATLQASQLSPLEIALGKLIAGWTTGMVFLGLAMPALLPSALIAQVNPLYVIRVVMMIALLALFLVSIGLGFSAIINRQLGSVVLTYGVVFGATVVLPIVFVSSLPFMIEERVRTVYVRDYPSYSESSADEDREIVCVKERKERVVLRTDLVQPLLWVNPLVMLADVAPNVPPSEMYLKGEYDGPRFDALIAMKQAVRSSHDPTHPSRFNSCEEGDPGYPDLGKPMQLPVWFFGSGMWALVSAGALLLTVNRLAIPIKTLGKGTRIA